MCFGFLILLGCSENYQKETWIERIVETGLSERERSFFKISRLRRLTDGKNDGVFYAVRFGRLNKLDGDQLKATLIPIVRTIINQDSEGKSL